MKTKQLNHKPKDISMAFQTVLTLTLCLTVMISGTAAQDSKLSTNPNPSVSKQNQNQKTKVKVKTSESVSKSKSPAVLQPETEKKLLKFVEQHHRELKPVLEHIKKNRPGDYVRALNQIKRASERIDVLKKRDPERHDIELGSWKAQSRIKLLAARLALAENDRTRGELKKSVKQEIQWRQKRIELDRKRTQQKMQRLDSQLKEIKKVDDKRLDRMVQNEINRMKPKPKKNKSNKSGSGKNPGKGK